MHKKAIFTVLFFLLVIGLGTSVFAQDFGLKATAEKAQYGETTDIYSAIGTVLRLTLSMVGLIFLSIMFYTGLRWMTARGNEEIATRAKDATVNAALGFMLIVAAYGLTVFVFDQLLK